MSEDFRSDPEAVKDKCALILIPGINSDVRPGIWSSQACVNGNLLSGSMLQQIVWANKKGYGVFIMNPCFNKDPSTFEPIAHNENMFVHAPTVWKTYIETSGFKQFYIIAQGTGGACVKTIQRSFPETFYKKVAKIALIDSTGVISSKELV